MINRFKQSAIFLPLLLIFPLLVFSSDNLTTKVHKVSNFTKIEAGGVFKISFKTGEFGPVVIEAEDFAHEKIEVTVSNGTLKLSSRNLRDMHHDIKVTITAPTLEAIDMSGASAFVSTGTIKTDKFDLQASGASEVHIGIAADVLTANISGAAKTHLKGSAGKIDAEVSGAGKFFAEQLTAGDADIDASGAGYAEVMVTGNLEAEASGAGSIEYHGNPRIRSHTSGAGSIRGKN